MAPVIRTTYELDSNDTDNTSPLAPGNHECVASSGSVPRKVFVIWNVEAADGMTSPACTYGGESATLRVNAQQGTSGYRNHSIIWEVDEDTLDTLGDDTHEVVITCTTIASVLRNTYYVVQVDGLTDQAPDDTDDAGSATSPVANSVSIASGDFCISGCSSSHDGSFTWDNSQVEQQDQGVGSSMAGGVATLTAAGVLSSLNTTFAGSVSRLARSCCVYEAYSSGLSGDASPATAAATSKAATASAGGVSATLTPATAQATSKDATATSPSSGTAQPATAQATSKAATASPGGVSGAADIATAQATSKAATATVGGAGATALPATAQATSKAATATAGGVSGAISPATAQATSVALAAHIGVEPAATITLDFIVADPITLNFVIEDPITLNFIVADPITLNFVLDMEE